MGIQNDPRESYIAIATRRFAADGYDGTSLARLAKDAGVTKQALLHFFGTKERLYADVLKGLALRLEQDIAKAQHDDATAHLLAYFAAFHTGALKAESDIRLVVRALLDSRETAQTWPLKPYLDQLADIACQTPGGRSAARADIIAWLSQIIGMIQYQVISKPAMTGMFGTEMAQAVTTRFEALLSEAVLRFADPDRLLTDSAKAAIGRSGR